MSYSESEIRLLERRLSKAERDLSEARKLLREATEQTLLPFNWRDRALAVIAKDRRTEK